MYLLTSEWSTQYHGIMTNIIRTINNAYTRTRGHQRVGFFHRIIIGPANEMIIFEQLFIFISDDAFLRLSTVNRDD